MSGMTTNKTEFSRTRNPVPYIRAYHQLRWAVYELKDMAGFQPSKPEIRIYNVPGNYTTAQLYKGVLYFYNPDAHMTDGTVPHEVYHHVANEFRKRAGDPDSETRFIATASNGVSAQDAVYKASALWNGVNEAGAYIFGLYSVFSSTFSDEKLAGKIISTMATWYDTGIEKVGEDVLTT